MRRNLNKVGESIDKQPHKMDSVVQPKQTSIHYMQNISVYKGLNIDFTRCTSSLVKAKVHCP